MNDQSIVDALSQFIQNHGMPKKQADKKAEDTVADRIGSKELRRTLFTQEFKRRLSDDDGIPYQVVDLATMSLNKVLDQVNNKSLFNGSSFKIAEYINKELQVFDVDPKILVKLVNVATQTWSEIYD